MSSFSVENMPSQEGKVILVTGGNVGLGFETVRAFVKQKAARIFLAARSKEKADASIAVLQGEGLDTDSVSFLELDLSSFDSIKAAVASFKAVSDRLDILINNAGIMMTAEGLTKNGFEIQFGTNVIGHALLAQLLLPTLRHTSKAHDLSRIVVVGSAAHARAPEDAYNFAELRTTAPKRHTTNRYTTSKLANLQWARALAEVEQDVKVVAVHPGMVATNLHKASVGSFLKPFLNLAQYFATPVEKGALSQLWAAVSPSAEHGHYYGPVGKEEPGSKLSQNREVQASLYRWLQDEIAPHLGRNSK